MNGRIDTFANRLNIAMKKNNINQIELSEKTKTYPKHISQSLINKYLKGKAFARQNNIYILCKILNVDEAWIMGFDVPMERTPDELRGQNVKRDSLGNPIVEIPILGTVKAGYDYLAEENWEGTVDIKKGDYVYIEAGTLHAAAKGSLIFEIEENSEVTYRFYDFDRIDKNGKKRPLQLDKALMCLDTKKPSSPEPMKQDGDNWYRHRMYSVKHFVKESVYTNNTKTVACATLMSGEATLSSGIKVTPGTAVLLEPNETIDFGKYEFMVTIPQYGFRL